jgi:hypothetical protein
MTDLDALRFPLRFLQSRLPDIQHRELLEAKEDWWTRISDDTAFEACGGR